MHLAKCLKNIRLANFVFLWQATVLGLWNSHSERASSCGVPMSGSIQGRERALASRRGTRRSKYPFQYQFTTFLPHLFCFASNSGFLCSQGIGNRCGRESLLWSEHPYARRAGLPGLQLPLWPSPAVVFPLLGTSAPLSF